MSDGKNTTRDLTTGSPMKLIIVFAVPLLGGFIFQQFYNIVDTMIVGRTLGVNALAGVGATGSINFFIIGFCTGICSGFAIPIAQRFGAKDYGAMRSFFANAFYLSVFFAAAVTIVISLLTMKILILMNTPEEVIEYSYDYISVIFYGIPAIMLFNLLAGIIRALGESRMPLVFLIISSVTNIVLDLFFILVLGLGVTGAALATVISQGFSGILCLVYIIRKMPILHIQKEEWIPNGDRLRVLLIMGVPMGLQYSVTAIGGLILQTAVNGLGPVCVAAQTSCGKVSMFFTTVFDALGTAMATYGGQNVGAKRLSRLGEGIRDSLILGMIYYVFTLLIIFPFGHILISAFVTDPSPELLTDAAMMLRMNALAYPLLLLLEVLRFMIQGMGYSGISIFSGVAELVARLIVALVLVRYLGFFGACLSNSLAWVMACAFLIPAYRYVFRKTCRGLGIQVLKH